MPDLIASLPKIDKHALIGSCMRLPISFDVERFKAEYEAIPTQYWGSRGGRVGVHVQAEAIFLRGYAPVEGPKPIQDREVTTLLPYTTHMIHSLLGAQPLRCLFAKLKAQGQVPIHVDNGEYFDKTVRVHFPVVTNPQAVMLAGGRAFHMAVGEVWALNNSGTHGVQNAHPNQFRTHMICDFVPSPNLLDLLSRGDRTLGTPCA